MTEEPALPREVEDLFRDHGNRVYSLLLRLSGNSHDAADLTQDVFLKAGRGLERFRGDAAELTWLLRIAINAHRDLMRRRRKAPISYEQAVQTGSLPEPATPGSSDEATESAEARRIVREALGDLEQDIRAILLLRDARGLAYRQIAETLGVPIGTVQSRLFRAREALREAVRRRYPDWIGDEPGFRGGSNGKKDRGPSTPDTDS
jgi:RNA polymerase sigma-70 factor (ECF subfamily)